MSLLDGLKEMTINPLFDSMMESDMDAAFDFEAALEAAVDKQIALSEDDIAAIMDDDNPDNVVADIGKSDERIEKIAKDSVDEEMQVLESLLDDLFAMESEEPEDDDSSEDPESFEGCGSKSTEACKKAYEDDDDDDDEDDEDDNDDENDKEDDDEEEEEEDDDYMSIDSLLESIFK